MLWLKMKFATHTIYSLCLKLMPSLTKSSTFNLQAPPFFIRRLSSLLSALFFQAPEYFKLPAFFLQAPDSFKLTIRIVMMKENYSFIHVKTRCTCVPYLQVI
ncbi:hypothetical protein ES332_A10G291900v1 [Gossypium tomentosum]|uniref:Uncharacterized protein n=1 Tax=Gossypium tomentosum TaxID=34277 RepID=A0A5D2NZ11_GOSTO|nr:hypothetical protein ES332_A10G291900v1 [Gossypium tomentosum]